MENLIDFLKDGVCAILPKAEDIYKDAVNKNLITPSGIKSEKVLTKSNEYTKIIPTFSGKDIKKLSVNIKNKVFVSNSERNFYNDANEFLGNLPEILANIKFSNIFKDVGKYFQCNGY